MGALNNQMTENTSAGNARKLAEKKLYANSKKFRAAQAIEAWKQVPEIGDKFDELDESTQENVAMNLTSQMRYMNKLTEAQFSQRFAQFTPENMLRVVRLSMPQCIRSKVFTEFALETLRDSIKYAKPVRIAPASGNRKNINRKNSKWNGDDDADLWEFDNEINDVNTEGYRTPLYESNEDRFTSELFNVAKAESGKYEFKGGAFGEDGKLYLDGYVVVYGKDERDTIAVQNKRTGTFSYGSQFYDADGNATISAKIVKDDAGVYALELTGEALPEVIHVFGRADTETDLTGESLGELGIEISDYFFNPRPTSIGLTWSQMTELSLDAGFNTNAEDFLVGFASQELRVELDKRAIRIAYNEAKTNGSKYVIHFDAAYNTTNAVAGNNGAKDGYVDNAVTFLTAIDKVGDIMLNTIGRGGVTRLVAGTSAATYMKLTGAYSPKGKMPNIGCHQYGEVDGIPLFKVPAAIIPDNEMLCVWKNPDQDVDVAVAFGTYVPFFSTGTIQRKNFYKEAAFVTYGDWNVLNKKYLALIVIDNMKDAISAVANNGTGTTSMDDASGN